MNRFVLHYQIVRRLAGGTVGEVHLAHDTKLDRPVVLKFLASRGDDDSDARGLLAHEARSLAQLSHPHIVTVHALETDGRRAFLVMEYVDGEPLSQLLALGPLPVLECIRVGIALAEALAHAHSRGVVHRDVKPDNILITVDGQVRLTDFGIAALQGRHAAAPELEFASCDHLAPEQSRREPLDGRADVYSLGLVLYECLTGIRPPAWCPNTAPPAPPVPLSQLRADLPHGLTPPSMRASPPSVPNALRPPKHSRPRFGRLANPCRRSRSRRDAGTRTGASGGRAARRPWRSSPRPSSRQDGSTAAHSAATSPTISWWSSPRTRADQRPIRPS